MRVFSRLFKPSRLILLVVGLMLFILSCTRLFDMINPNDPGDPAAPFTSISRNVPFYDALPAPAAVSGATEDDSIGNLAWEVMRGDTLNVVASLERALLMAGIGIRDSRTKMLLFDNLRNGNSGVVLQDWEVNCLAKQAAAGMHMNLGDFAAITGFTELGLDSAKMLDAICSGLLASAATTDTSAAHLRVWAKLVNKLTEFYAPTPSILVGAAGTDRGNTPINLLQASLIALRLAGDLESYMRLHPVPAAKSGTAVRAQAECQFDDATSSIMDHVALGSTYGMGKVLDYLDGLGMEAAGKYATASGAVSAALAIIKYIASGAALHTQLDLEEGEPLMRTTTTQPGERKTLRGKAWYDIGNWSMLNCARIALNAANVDFNLPTSGPITDSKVAWSLDIGSTNFGTDVIQNSIVQFYSLDGKAITQMKTDAQGMSRVGIEGAKQGHDLVPPLIPEYKSAKVCFRVAMNSQKIYTDILSGVGVLTSGPFFPITLVTELLSRIPIHGRALTFPVKDWIEHPQY